MGEADEDKSLPSNASIDSDAASPVLASAFEPGIIWKTMGTFWKFPDWHWAWLRSEKKGLFHFQKVDANQPETVLAGRTLDELRGLILAVISCGRLYRHDVAGHPGAFKAAGLTLQTVFSINRRSLSLHDRISMLPSLSGLLENNCIVCSIFHTVRWFVLAQLPAELCGTPNEWETAIIEGGNPALLDLFRQFESAGGESVGISVTGLKRHTTLVAGLMNIAKPTAAQDNTISNTVGMPAKTPMDNPNTISTGSHTGINASDGNTGAGSSVVSENISQPDTLESGEEENQSIPEDLDGTEGIAGDAVDGDGTTTTGQTEGKRRQGYRTTALMQYYALRVLLEQYRADSDASMKANELCKRIRELQRGDRGVVGLDETYCHAAINDLRKRFQRDCPEINITKGKYLLKFGHYARKSDVEKMIDALKTASES